MTCSTKMDYSDDERGSDESETRTEAAAPQGASGTADTGADTEEAQEAQDEEEALDHCGRCSVELDGQRDGEVCYHCHAWLCCECWELVGHCGHSACS